MFKISHQQPFSNKVKGKTLTACSDMGKQHGRETSLPLDRLIDGLASTKFDIDWFVVRSHGTKGAPFSACGFPLTPPRGPTKRPTEAMAFKLTLPVRRPRRRSEGGQGQVYVLIYRRMKALAWLTRHRRTQKVKYLMGPILGLDYSATRSNPQSFRRVRPVSGRMSKMVIRVMVEVLQKTTHH